MRVEITKTIDWTERLLYFIETTYREKDDGFFDENLTPLREAFARYVAEEMYEQTVLPHVAYAAWSFDMVDSEGKQKFYDWLTRLVSHALSVVEDSIWYCWTYNPARHSILNERVAATKGVRGTWCYTPVSRPVSPIAGED